MKRIVWALVLFLSASAFVFAQEDPPLFPEGIAGDGAAGKESLLQRFGLSGSLRGGFWSSSRTLDDKKGIPTGSVWGKAAPRLGENASLHLDGWVGRLSTEPEIGGHLREGYLQVRSGPVDLRVGQQIIVWGRADRINPTDNLTPRDYRLLVPDDDDQRLGTLAVRGNYYRGTLSFTGIWLPRFRPDELPLRSLPAPLSFGETLPDRRYQQGAVKVEQTGLAIDWSLSYFRGYDLFPDIAIAPTPSGATLLLEHHPIRVIGADAATNAGRYGLRAEAAYTLTEDPHGEDPEVKNPFFFLVAGGDRTFYEYMNLNVQYILRVVRSYRNPESLSDPLQRAVAVQQAVLNNQIDRIQQGVSIRVSNKWWNETLEGELAGIIFFPRHDYAIRPKVTYAFNDRWRGVIGGDLFRGRDDSFFGYLKENSTIYAEVRWLF